MLSKILSKITQLVLVFTAITYLVSKTEPAKAKLNFVYKEPPKKGLAFKWGKEEFSESQLIDENDPDIAELRSKEYKIKMKRIKDLVTERLLGSVAKKEGKSIDEYLEHMLSKKNFSPSTKEIKEFVKEKKIPSEQVEGELLEKIKDHLSKEKKKEALESYLVKLMNGQTIEVYFKKPTSTISLTQGDSPFWGDKNAKTTMFVFSDFECPYCKKAAEIVSELQKKLGKKNLKIVFKHFPLPMHKEAPSAHEATICVNKVAGSEKFWEMHDLVFKADKGLSEESLLEYAASIGVNQDKLISCLQSGVARETVRRDIEYGRSIHIRGTPTIFINNELYQGQRTPEKIIEYIKGEE